MATCAVLLRAINLGSRNKIGMPALTALIEACGVRDVTSYVQSGNVIGRAGRSTPAKLESAIAGRIADDLGLDITVLVRTAAQLDAIAAGNPFLTTGAEPGHLHVTFLATKPPADQVKALAARSFPPDEFAVVGREVYLHCPDGYGRSKLNNAFFEKQLGVSATTRNWRTVTALVERVAALG